MAIPIQYTPFTAEHFSTPEGVAFVNLQMQQMVNAINAGNGAAGRVALPNGVDMKGSTVSNVGAPTSESDAISSGHAEAKYSAASVSPSLDIGGKNALKGLSYLYEWQQSNAQLSAGVSGTITIPKLTSGGTNGSITVTKGIITAFKNPT